MLTSIMIASCSSGNGGGHGRSDGTGSGPSSTGPTTSSPKAPGTEEPDAPLPRLGLDHVDVELDSPIAAIPLPENRGNGLIVAERAGVVRVIDLNGPTPRLSEPAVDISDDVSVDMERGLLGIALNAKADRLFLSYTNSKGDSRLDMYDAAWPQRVRGASSPMVVEKSSGRELLAVDQPYANHNGGHIEFGPDGMLYLGLGDGGAGGDPHGNAQSRSTLLGKLVRLDPTRDPARGLAPSDNPFVEEDGTRPEIWSTGLRNPWRFSFDSGNGDLWVADVGQDRIEEVNRITQAQGGGRGANLGWDLFEGNERFTDANPAPSPASDGPFVEPVFVYEHGPGCSVTGGVVYRGRVIPGLVGRYLFSDYCDGTIRVATPSADGRVTVTDVGVAVDQPVGFATDTDGEVYVISMSGGLQRVRAAD